MSVNSVPATDASALGPEQDPPAPSASARAGTTCEGLQRSRRPCGSAEDDSPCSSRASSAPEELHLARESDATDIRVILANSIPAFRESYHRACHEEWVEDMSWEVRQRTESPYASDVGELLGKHELRAQWSALGERREGTDMVSMLR